MQIAHEGGKIMLGLDLPILEDCNQCMPCKICDYLKWVISEELDAGSCQIVLFYLNYMSWMIIWLGWEL